MGVEQDHYVIVGIKTKFKKIEELFNVGEDDDLKLDGVVDQWHDPKAGDFVYITDGMNGKYDVIGKLIQKGEGWEGLDMTDCLAVYRKHITEVKKKLKALNISLGEVSVFAFTHFH
jgi:hypothetical protein